jgi:hypothetical protein
VFGDPISFSTGFSAVPEPSSRAIVILACLVLGFRKGLVCSGGRRGAHQCRRPAAMRSPHC